MDHLVLGHPICRVGLEEPKAAKAEKVNYILTGSSVEGAPSRVDVSVWVEMLVAADVHPLVRCHSEPGDLHTKL